MARSENFLRTGEDTSVQLRKLFDREGKCGGSTPACRLSCSSIQRGVHKLRNSEPIQNVHRVGAHGGDTRKSSFDSNPTVKMLHDRGDHFPLEDGRKDHEERHIHFLDDEGLPPNQTMCPFIFTNIRVGEVLAFMNLAIAAMAYLSPLFVACRTEDELGVVFFIGDGVFYGNVSLNGARITPADVGFDEVSKPFRFVQIMAGGSVVLFFFAPLCFCKAELSGRLTIAGTLLNTIAWSVYFATIEYDRKLNECDNMPLFVGFFAAVLLTLTGYFAAYFDGTG